MPELTIFGGKEGKSKYKKLNVDQMSLGCTASLKLLLFIICHSSTRAHAAGCLWLVFLCRSEGNCLVLSADWFYWGAQKCLVNVDLQMENQIMIHLSVL